MKCPDFFVGDRVVAMVNKNFIMKGDTGTVRVLYPNCNRNTPSAGVEWDKEIAGGHDLGGAIKRWGHGWWVCPADIQAINAKNDNIEPILFDDLATNLFE